MRVSSSRPRPNRAEPDSPEIDGERYVAVGRIGRPHGILGEVRLDPMGTMPKGLKRYPALHCFRPDGTVEVLKVDGWRWSGDMLLVKFAGSTDRDGAALITNRLVYVPRSALPKLGEGEYYHADLPGLPVFDGDGVELGVVEDVKPWGEYDMLFIRTGSKVWLLPVIGDYVLEIEPESGRIVVAPPEGLGP